MDAKTRTFPMEIGKYIGNQSTGRDDYISHTVAGFRVDRRSSLHARSLSHKPAGTARGQSAPAQLTGVTSAAVTCVSDWAEAH